MLSIDAAIPYPDPPLTGATFLLRPFRVQDFEAAYELGQDPATALWMPPLPAADGAGVVEYFEQCRRQGGLLDLVIADLARDAYLGEVVVVLGEHRVGELGCGVVPAARRRGVGTEALRLLGDWALSTLGLGRLHVFVASQNVAALGLVRRAGFRHEGILRAYWDTGGERLDAVVLSRLPTDGA
jgi:RimJ/RimL family protein N-acetyltransferase